MVEGSQDLVRRYGGAALVVAAAAVVTDAFPLLRERFTFFLFWPLVMAVAWFAGPGPGLVATALSAVVVCWELASSPGVSPFQPDLLSAVAAFTVIGGVSALVARLRAGAESALRESHDRFQTLADAAPVLVWMSGPDRRLTYVNRAWLAFTGRSLADELGDGWREGVHPEDRAPWIEAYGEAFAARRPFELQYRLRRHDGVYRYLLARGIPRFGAPGALLGYIGSCTDITEQREALARAESAKASAEAASRAKDAFMATVSHELRAPLSPILTWARLLRDDALPREQAVRALEVIERNARMQAQLIEDLLDVARIVEGKLRLQVRPVALADVVQNAVDTTRPAAQAKDIRLQVVLDTTVPAIPGDADRLQQVVWNLLSNAVKFTPKGGRVHVVLERVNSHIEIAVSDTGQGIGEEQRPHLFERFWQADATTTRTQGGLGLGLAIVRHLVELHGGSVVAESPGEGRGSTFTVKLPVVPVARTAGEPVRRHPVLHDGDRMGPVPLDGVRVLLVDDEPDVNESLRVLLDQCGAEVRVAGSAAHALQILGRWHPEVLVSDIGMPGEDGYALLGAIRARPDDLSRLPAIALTAYASREDRARLLAAGFQLHVVKPAEPAELTAAIASVAARRSA